VEHVYEGLKDFSEHAKVWRAQEIPVQFHYNHNDRIPPVLIMPDDGWFLVNNTHDKLPMSKLFYPNVQYRKMNKN